MEILYHDASIIVCVKPIGAQSEDGAGQNSVPALLRSALNLAPDAAIFTVHRLDKQVSGVMVYAKTKQAAAHLSAQMQHHKFCKIYRAITEGSLPTQMLKKPPSSNETVPCGTQSNRENFGEHPTQPPSGRWEDLLYHDKRKNKVFAVNKARKGVKTAALQYRVLAACQPQAAQPLWFSLLEITLETGRTHQIRVQCASRQLPLVGDNRYGAKTKGCNIALFSYKIGFTHPESGKFLTFSQPVPDTYPWNLF